MATSALSYEMPVSEHTPLRYLLTTKHKKWPCSTITQQTTDNRCYKGIPDSGEIKRQQIHQFDTAGCNKKTRVSVPKNL